MKINILTAAVASDHICTSKYKYLHTGTQTRAPAVASA